MRFSARVILILSLPLLASTGAGQSMSPLDSSLDAHVYTNFFFRLRYPFSASWVPALATDQRQRISPSCLGNAGETGTFSPDRNLHDLLILERDFPGHGGIGDAKGTIWLIAENVSGEPSLSGGKACLEKLSERARARHLSPTRDIREVKLMGKSFFRLDLAGVSAANTPLHETALFTLAQGYALGFVLTAPSEQALTGMVSTLDKLESF